jgi:hypothetical protein
MNENGSRFLPCRDKLSVFLKDDTRTHQPSVRLFEKFF